MRQQMLQASQQSKRPNVDPARLFESANRLLNRGQRRSALKITELASSLGPDTPRYWAAVGRLFTECNAPARALPVFERASAADPRNPEYSYYLAVVQRMMGDFESAETNLDKVLLARPDFYGAHYMRADLRTQTSDRNHVEVLRRLLARSTCSGPADTLLYFALAKELEDVGEYADSFQILKRGADLHRQLIDYDVSDEIAAIDSLIEVHSAKAIGRPPGGFDTDECIFVIGLPRTGTTLVERILSSHPLVEAGGELPTFPLQLASRLDALPIRPITMRACLQHALLIDPHALGRDYLEAIGPRSGGAKRFTDKLPLNYLHAGIIHRALPGARFIALDRQPMDACYAMYKTLFTGAYRFSYDLSELARYYVAWHALMRHWKDVLGDALLTLRYEALVADQATVTREIISHCRLPWDDRCLAFHRQELAESSASAVQVRQPIYTSSVGKWKNYASQLAPLREGLQTLDWAYPDQIPHPSRLVH
jgi:tetratricopeptide (TPR) repeat protein